MLFNSPEFLVFLVLVLALYYGAIPRRFWGARKVALIVASYLFYMNWNPYFGAILLGSTVCDFTLGLVIQGATTPRRRRLCVAASVCVNLGILCLFKYGRFLLENGASLLSLVVGPTAPPALEIALPIGISFYTFESLSYVIDVYRGMPATRNFLDFALFLSFFPHLVAGPIVRPAAFLPQLLRAPRIDGALVEAGLARIAVGLVKKVVFADTFGTYVDTLYGSARPVGPGNTLLGVYSYAFQIYFDFSGYTDMALGLAMLFGLSLPENFDRPYLASSPRDFWRRWHISLSTWLRDYLYIPLGGNRRSPARTHVNLLLTMLLGGLWHGAAWNFVLWGGFHGVLLSLQHLIAPESRARAPRRGLLTLQRVLTFHLVCFGWILFRSPSLEVMRRILAGFTSTLPFAPTRAASLALILLPLAVLLHATGTGRGARAWFVRLPPGHKAQPTPACSRWCSASRPRPRGSSTSSSDGASTLVYRILGILGSFVACSALLVWSVLATVGPEALQRGAATYVYRKYFQRILGDPKPAVRALVVYMGDSTIMSPKMSPKRPSYPVLLKPRLLQLGASTLVIAGAGFDAYVHYFLIGRVLELEPAVVVIVAHLSGFHPKNRAFTYNDTCSYLLPAELPRTMLLPLAERQLSPARVLLAQTLNLEMAEQLLYTVEGLHLLYQEAAFWAPLGPPNPPAVFNPFWREVIKDYNIKLSRRQPTVRMLEATVRAVTEAGHTALVVATPIPFEAMQKRPWFDAATVQRQVDVLRAVVEDAGGMFADLHKVLPQKEFADFGGHFAPVGAQHVSDLVFPFVRQALRRAATAANAPPTPDDTTP